MKISDFIRKSRSAVSLFGRLLGNNYCRLRIYLSGNNVVLGKNVTFGSKVKIRTTDGGKIVIGDNVAIDDYALVIASFGQIKIGSHSYIGVGTHIVALENISIGDGALIAAYSVIRDMNHGLEKDKPMYQQKQTSAPVFIGDDVWLGAHVVVTAGAKIHAGSVIGANAVVSSEIPALSIAVGLPAKPIRER